MKMEKSILLTSFEFRTTAMIGMMIRHRIRNVGTENEASFPSYISGTYHSCLRLHRIYCLHQLFKNFNFRYRAISGGSAWRPEPLLKLHTASADLRNFSSSSHSLSGKLTYLCYIKPISKSSTSKPDLRIIIINYTRVDQTGVN